jgi:hypothetical protein
MRRKIPVNKEESKNIKKLLLRCKNQTERSKVMIISTYLWGKNTMETGRSLGTFQWTVLKVIDAYIEDKEWFYKTKYKWKKTSERNQEIKDEIKKYIEESIENEKPVDINDVRAKINKKYQEEVLDYGKCWAIVRKFFKYNYQKPYVTSKKQPEHAKEIAEWRLRKAIFKVALEEWEIDAEAIKNKKTKVWGIVR